MYLNPCNWVSVSGCPFTLDALNNIFLASENRPFEINHLGDSGIRNHKKIRANGGKNETFNKVLKSLKKYAIPIWMSPPATKGMLIITLLMAVNLYPTNSTLRINGSWNKPILKNAEKEKNMCQFICVESICCQGVIARSNA